MVINVVNKKSFKGDGIYVARPSIFGNPFPILDFNRAECIRKYATWFEGQLANDSFKSSLDSLYEIAKKGELNLVCWCHPKECHATVIKRYLEKRYKMEVEHGRL